MDSETPQCRAAARSDQPRASPARMAAASLAGSSRCWDGRCPDCTYGGRKVHSPTPLIGWLALLIRDQHAHRLTCGDMPCGRDVVAVSEDGALRRRGHGSWSRSTGAGSSWIASSATAAASIRPAISGWRPAGRRRPVPAPRADGGHLGEPLEVQGGGDRRRAHLPDGLAGRAHPAGLRDDRALPLGAASDPPTLRVVHPHAVVVGLVALAAGHRRITTGRRGPRHRSSRSRGGSYSCPQRRRSSMLTSSGAFPTISAVVPTRRSIHASTSWACAARRAASPARRPPAPGAARPPRAPE
jgi:hypothetical protein